MRQLPLGDTRIRDPMIAGAKHRNGYKASVIGILGKNAPRVFSKGSRFYNKDRWTVRIFLKIMCEWATKNPGCVPTTGTISDWVINANKSVVPASAREIVIANTPDKLPLRTALALTGGAYHEALHTLLSPRRNLTVAEMRDLILPRWAKVKDWSRFLKALLQWTNLIEDIRIERRGCEQFDSIHVKMCDLQDFILKQEEKGDDNVRSHGGKPGVMSVVERTFRDMGLGYNTEIQRSAIDQYRQDAPDAVELVLSGPLVPYLKEAIELAPDDDLGHLRLAMDVITKLAEIGGADQQDQQSKQGQSGDGKLQCPSCGALAANLVVRPQSDGAGGKVPGKGIVTCTVCGHQEQVDVEAKPKDQQGDKDKKPSKQGPKYDGFDKEDEDRSGGGSGGKGEEDDKKDGGSSTGGGSDDNDVEGDDKEGSGGGTDDDKEGNAGGGEEGNEEGDEKGEDEEGTAGSQDDDAEGNEGEAEQGSSAEDGDNLNAPGGAGGHSQAPEKNEGWDWQKLAETLIAQGNEETGLLDVNEALEQSVNAVMEQEDKDVEPGEAVWSPYDPGLDEVNIVRPSARGKMGDTRAADVILQSVKEQITFLRSRLRTVVRSMEQTKTVHGLPQGRRVSQRFLVDTKVALMGGRKPTRAYCVKGDKIDMKVAAAIVVDESGSMGNRKLTAAQIFLAITEPLDNLGCPVLALGFRNGRNYTAPDAEEKRKYHRYGGVIYDIFKGWNEKLRAIRWRFANTRAQGGTPMADGIQFALTALSQRSESNRFLFVVTDGQPDYGNKTIINRQIKLAKKAGIHVIGVGIGKWATYVRTLFPDHVWSNRVEEFPNLLIKKLNELVDLRVSRGGRLRL